jgi:hypothetical protein
MAEFSAHRVQIPEGGRFVISTPINLFVSTTGDDVVNTGVDEGSPFRTPQRAFDWLSDKLISDSGFVTINFAAGIYNIEDTIEVGHPNGERIALVGAEPETLRLQKVTYYSTFDYDGGGTGYDGYFSNTIHGITAYCVKPDTNTGFTLINESTNPIKTTCKVPGSGVVIYDYDLAFDEDYNPAVAYASFPIQPRNNLARQSTILGSHLLSSATGGTINIYSSIRDDFFSIPFGGRLYSTNQQGTSFGVWARYYGNPFPLDLFEDRTGATLYGTDVFGSNNWLLPTRGHYLGAVPVGYYGTPSVTGIPNGATSNFTGASFPRDNVAGETGIVFYDQDFYGTTYSWFTSAGPAGSILEDSLAYGNNYHRYSFNITGTSGEAFSANWKTVNSNMVVVTIIPTVFRRQSGKILSVKSSGLRKIKNIFFNGVNMPYYYNLIGPGRLNTSGTSNKYGIYAAGSRFGESVSNEPVGLGDGLFTNVGFKDFHVGVYCDRSTSGDLGRVAVSNSTYGILANNGSAVKVFGSVVTGSIFGYSSFNSSNMNTERCFSSFSGHSLVELKLTGTPGNTGTFTDSSYLPGQTFETNDGKIKGVVFDWDPVGKFLTLAVREGILEANRISRGVI